MNLRNERQQKPIQIGNYQLRTTIGKGYSAIVKLATHVLIGQKVAIKLFDRAALDADIEKTIRLKREINSMKSLKHTNIIKLYEVMETPKLVYVVTEFASNGDLYDFIMKNKRLSEREARHYFKQIIHAVDYCHRREIVHRDIKIENLLLDSQNKIKLADFGFSCRFTPGELLDVWCGSPPYCAPELFNAELYDGPKVDIWSCGVVLYILVCRRFPFDATSYNKLRSQVISGYYTTPFFLSEECKNLISAMLTVNPKDRFTMKDIMNHTWFRLDAELESRNLINEIEHFTINESIQLDENILNEVHQMGFSIDQTIDSLKQQKFDDKQAIYLLLEDRQRQQSLIGTLHNHSYNSCMKRQSINSNNDDFDETHGFTLEKQRNMVNFVDNQVIANNNNNNNNNTTTQIENHNGSQDSGMNTDDNESIVMEEELSNYLKKKGALRRHTIGTNNPGKLMEQQNLLTSTECLLKYAHVNQQINSSNYNTATINDSGINEEYLYQQQQQQQQQEQEQEQLMYQQLYVYNAIATAQAYQQQQQQQQQMFVPPPLTAATYRRRTSDGGSNISIFNQQFCAYRQEGINNFSGSTASSLQQLSRGSITSGTPIKMQSFDADDQQQQQSSSTSMLKKQKTRQRHEPYGNTEEVYKSHHRSSEPNHFDLIRNYRQHYEQLYNQKIQAELETLHKTNQFDLLSSGTCTSPQEPCLPTPIEISSSIPSSAAVAAAVTLPGPNQQSLPNTPSSSSLLHMIKEEQQADMSVSSSTTPRLSQSSTIATFDSVSGDTNDLNFQLLMTNAYVNRIPEEYAIFEQVQQQQAQHRRYSIQFDKQQYQQQQQQQQQNTHNNEFTNNPYYSYYPTTTRK